MGQLGGHLDGRLYLSPFVPADDQGVHNHRNSSLRRMIFLLTEAPFLTEKCRNYGAVGRLAKELSGSRAGRQDYLYNGKEWNEDLGLDWYDYGFRYYDATIGRFTGVDPIADRFAWVSVYNYAENDPISGIDLWGLQYVNTNTGESRGPIDPLNSKEGVSEEFDVNRNGVQDHYLPVVEISASRSTQSNRVEEGVGTDVIVDPNVQDNSESSSNTALYIAGFNYVRELAENKMYNDETWYSLYKMKTYKQTFNGNGYTGGKKAHALYWSKSLDKLGKGLGVFSAANIGRQYYTDEIGLRQMLIEQGSNAYSTFGGLPGAGWGIGWELGRALSKTDSYHKYFYLKLHPEGRDGLLSTYK